MTHDTCKHVGVVVGTIVGLLIPAGLGSAHEAHESVGAPAGQAAQAPEQQTLTGEVVDVLCYLSHPKEGLGKEHAGCARKCIKSGLPVAIKVGDQLYLAAMANHEPANKALERFAGEQVIVHGDILEKDGQHLIAISKIEKAQ